MIFKAYDFHFESILSNIDVLYQRLRLSNDRILQMVEDDNDLKGFYNPKRDIILECENKLEFERFQSLLRGLNNHIYYNSLLLSSYSIFENSIKLICKFISDHIDPKIEFEDYRRDILKNCMDYITKTKLVNFNEKELDIIYSKISKVKKFRNLVAHYNGNLFTDNKRPIVKQENFNLFKSDNRLRIFDDGQVYIDNNDYIRAFVSDSEYFLKTIIERIKTTANKQYS